MSRRQNSGAVAIARANVEAWSNHDYDTCRPAVALSAELLGAVPIAGPCARGFLVVGSVAQVAVESTLVQLGAAGSSV
jgi:hypothetical protein